MLFFLGGYLRRHTPVLGVPHNLKVVLFTTRAKGGGTQTSSFFIVANEVYPPTTFLIRDFILSYN